MSQIDGVVDLVGRRLGEFALLKANHLLGLRGLKCGGGFGLYPTLFVAIDLVHRLQLRRRSHHRELLKVPEGETGLPPRSRWPQRCHYESVSYLTV